MSEPELNETVGDHDLCAWRVAPGWVWIQTRRPEISSTLRNRSAFRAVAYGVRGGYLRTFESQMTLAQAESLIIQLRGECLHKLTGKQGSATPNRPQLSFDERRL